MTDANRVGNILGVSLCAVACLVLLCAYFQLDCDPDEDSSCPNTAYGDISTLNKNGKAIFACHTIAFILSIVNTILFGVAICTANGKKMGYMVTLTILIATQALFAVTAAAILTDVLDDDYAKDPVRFVVCLWLGAAMSAGAMGGAILALVKIKS